MRDEKGFTLIEVLLAVLILAVALTALAGLAGSTIKSTETGKSRTQAVNLAAEKIEALSSIPYYDIQSSGTDGGITRTCTALSGTPPVCTCTPSPNTVTLGNMQFTWSWQVTYIDLDDDGSYYSFAPVIQTTDMKRIDISVTWSDLFGSHTITIPALRKT